MEDVLDIGDVARRTGLTLRALRFYEARGLVAPLRTAGGRRVYGRGELARLNAAVALKQAGFSLAEIGRLLGGRPVDLGRLVAARLAAIETRAAAIADARALLQAVLSRIDRGEPIDVATLCSLIRNGDGMMEAENWADVADRYFSPEQRAHWAERLKAMPADFDLETYNDCWAELGTRIGAALPLDPASPPAQALYDEWTALLAPFTAVATPAMMQGVGRMYDGIDDWQHQQQPPFSSAVWAFIKAVGETRRAGA